MANNSNDDDDDILRFVGRIRDGIGEFSGLALPGKDDIPTKIKDWPTDLEPGRLGWSFLAARCSSWLDRS